MSNNDSEISVLLDQLFRQAQMQFGNAVRSRWMHDGDVCPGCGREIDEFNFKGNRAISLNAFMYRAHAVLIAYLLCGKCAKKILKASERNPNGKTPLHSKIERNLQDAYVKHLGH